MYITQVTITVHEKRNHPYEYGHRDAEVQVTAQLTPYESFDVTVETLRINARLHVENELDAWIKGIEQHRLEVALAHEINGYIDRLSWCRLQADVDAIYAKTRDLLAGSRLNVNELLERLETAKADAQERIANSNYVVDDDADTF